MTLNSVMHKACLLSQPACSQAPLGMLMSTQTAAGYQKQTTVCECIVKQQQQQNKINWNTAIRIYTHLLYYFSFKHVFPSNKCTQLW